MDKSFIKKILAVVLGISLVIMIYETFSLIVGAVLVDDLKLLNTRLNDLQTFMKWSAVALACMLIPTLASYVFAFFGKGKLLSLLAAILSLVITVCCVVFFCVCRSYALQGFSTTNYASSAAYLAELIQLAVAAALCGVYFLVTLKRPAKKELEVKENGNEEV